MTATTATETTVETTEPSTTVTGAYDFAALAEHVNVLPRHLPRALAPVPTVKHRRTA